MDIFLNCFFKLRSLNLKPFLVGVAYNMSVFYTPLRSASHVMRRREKLHCYTGRRLRQQEKNEMRHWTKKKKSRKKGQLRFKHVLNEFPPQNRATCFMRRFNVRPAIKVNSRYIRRLFFCIFEYCLEMAQLNPYYFFFKSCYFCLYFL